LVFLTKTPLSTSLKQLTSFQRLPGERHFFSWKQFSTCWVETAHKFLREEKLPPARNTITHARQRSPRHAVSTSQKSQRRQNALPQRWGMKRHSHLSGFLPANYPLPIPSPELLCDDSQANPDSLGLAGPSVR